MPIGSAKIGVLGAGLVPGGTQTFNASGTFSVPPGVKKVNITGKGGTGNPGNAGNPGNSGNSGNGGAGGGGGSTTAPYPYGYTNSASQSGRGGWAYKSGWPNTPAGPSLKVPGGVPGIGNWFNQSAAPPTWSPGLAMGAPYTKVCSVPGGANKPRNNAQSGTAGDAGNAGTAGNPGNTGNSSTGLCKTFTGGAGGNAGAGGAAGNGGSGGTAGTSGGNWCNRSAGAGGNGAGSGGSGLSSCFQPSQASSGASGGGGAGVANDGQSARPALVSPNPAFPNAKVSYGGTCPAVGSGFGLGFPCQARYNTQGYSPPGGAAPSYMIGGMGGSRGCAQAFGALINTTCICACSASIPNRTNTPLFGMPNANLWRSGAGGGASGTLNPGPPWNQVLAGGGGGGGGRGALGGTGGTSPTPSGSAANPSTFNCVPVTPGGSYPISVAAPGGQIVISWNPQ